MHISGLVNLHNIIAYMTFSILEEEYAVLCEMPMCLSCKVICQQV